MSSDRVVAHMDDDTFDAAVTRFYQAAQGALTWGEAFEPLVRFFDAWGIQFGGLSLQTGALAFSFESGHAPPEAVLQWIQTWHHVDPRWRLLGELEVGQWMRCHDHFDDEYVANSSFYQDFQIPSGGRYVSAGKVFQDAELAVIFGIFRPIGTTPLSTDELAIARRLGVHLGKAVELWRSQKHLAREASAGMTVIDRMRQPVIVVDDQRRVLFSNPGGRHLLDTGSGLVERDGLLACERRDDDTQLVFALRALRLAGESSYHDTLEAREKVILRIKRAIGQPPLIAYLIAARPERSLGAFGARSVALVMVHDPEVRLRPDPLIVAQTFDLTPAEARVAVALAEGCTPQKIAERHHVSIGTIRTQLKQVFAKIGVERQAELVGLLAALPTATLDI